MATATEESTDSNRNWTLILIELVAVVLFLAFLVNLLITSQLGMESLFTNVQQYLMLMIMSFLVSGDMIAKQILSK
jgi:uncharacterized integral membrane protein